MKIAVFSSEETPEIRARNQNSKAPEGWRTPGRSAHNEGVVQRVSVLDCGGPPPLFRWTAMAVMILFFALGVMAQTTNTLSDAEIQGHNLAQQLADAKPTGNFTNTGVLQIRDSKGERKEFPFRCDTLVTETNWQSVYETVTTYDCGLTNKNLCGTDGNYLKIIHTESRPTEYTWNNLNSPRISPLRSDLWESKWTGTSFICPFFHSDFWAVDLGLEFFHWPEQKILKKEFSRGHGCMVLESTNPNPSANGYSRVVSWIDEESYGIVHAEAFDANNKKLKEFDPKSFKKVNGQWELKDMEIRNVQTDSRTRIEFDLKAK